MDSILLLEQQYPVLLVLICFVFGAVIGSFLNVVVYRLPIMMFREMRDEAQEILEQLPEPLFDKLPEPSLDKLPEPSLNKTPEPFNLAVPRSRCPNCDHHITALENIPILSYVFLRGKCSNCQTKISLRYPCVELLSGILTALVIYMIGANLAGLAICGLTFALISLSLIDYDHMLLPDDITLPLIWIGLIVNYFELITGFSTAFWGAVGGYMCLWTVFQVFRLVTGKEGIGFGDFKLLAVLGAWLGWQLLPLIIVLSSFTGALIGGGLILLGRDRHKPIPFGPFLAMAGFITLLWGNEITHSYLKFMAS